MSPRRGAGDLEAKVSRFAAELEDLSESEHRELAEDSLGFGESWFGDVWSYEVDRGDD